MTAPRNCRACGTPLPPSVRWCHLCYTPVVELSPRPKDGRGYVGELRPVARYSRWRGSALTFGPVGRVAITTAVVLLGLSSLSGGFNPSSLYFLCGYAFAAPLVLKETWKKVRIPDDEPPAPGPVTQRLPVHRRPINLRILAGAGALVVAGLTISALHGKGAGQLFLPAAALVLLAAGAFLAWLTGI